MLNVLIIDDANGKIDRIKRVLGEFGDSVANPVPVARSQIDAKLLLSDQQFDLVVLDIQLPNRTGDTPMPDGGAKLLREIHSRSRYMKPYCIAGLTAYPDGLDSVGELFGEYLWSIILYEENSDHWEDVLRNRIEYLLELHRSEASGKTFGHDLGVVTALGEPEFEAVLRLADWVPVDGVSDDSRYMESSFAGAGKQVSVVAACLPQMGMPSAAVGATKMIFHFCPRYLSMVGITAGVRGQVEIGDIVVADPCWDWGSGKLTLGDTGDVFQPDPLPHRLDSHLRALFLETQRDKELLHRVWEEWPGSKPDSPPKLHVGPCVSGACVLANENSVQGICEHSRKLVGIDMEAYGVMHAGSQSLLPHPLTFSMKGVSDFADSAKDDSYRDYAAYVSAAVLRAVAVKFFGKPAV